MASTASYATIVELKVRLDITDADHDAELTAVIQSASRMVDGWCDRAFGTVDEARAVSASTEMLVYPGDDLTAVTELATDDTVDGTFTTIWDASDYTLMPGHEPPYSTVRATGERTFPCGFRRVRITGTWGYDIDIPMAINEATLLQATRLYKRKDAPFGITGSAELGTLQVIGSMDPDVKQLIEPYKRPLLVV